MHRRQQPNVGYIFACEHMEGSKTCCWLASLARVSSCCPIQELANFLLFLPAPDGVPASSFSLLFFYHHVFSQVEGHGEENRTKRKLEEGKLRWWSVHIRLCLHVTFASCLPQLSYSLLHPFFYVLLLRAGLNLRRNSFHSNNRST
jgi:hypothetical protein